MTESIFHVPKLRTQKRRATLLAAATSRFSPEAISIERLYRSSRLLFMNLPARLSLVGLLLVLAGCSTVESRIQGNPAAFASLSPADQALVRQGNVRAGMPKAAVYIAWAVPTRCVEASEAGVRMKPGCTHRSGPFTLPPITLVSFALGFTTITGTGALTRLAPLAARFTATSSVLKFRIKRHSSKVTG